MSGLMQKQTDCKLLRKNLGREPNCQVCKKYQLFLWSNGMVTGNIFRAKVVTNKKLDKYLAILKIGDNLENHDDGRMKKKLNFS